MSVSTRVLPVTLPSYFKGQQIVKSLILSVCTLSASIYWHPQLPVAFKIRCFLEFQSNSPDVAI